MKAGIDQEAIAEMFATATAKGGEQLRKAVGDATLAALQGRELTLKNIRSVLKTVAGAASAGAARNAATDAEALLDKAVAGMDDALVKAVEANRVALQRLLAQGADLREKNLKKALEDLDAMEDTFIGALKKAGEAAGAQLQAQWAPVLEKMQAGGTMSGAQAAAAAEQFATQVQSAMRDSRAAGLRAVQSLAEGYATLVSGVLIGMSDALQSGASAAPAKPSSRSRR